MKLTKEQKNIVNTLKAGKDVRVTAVAGSGKTTTILGLVGSDLDVLVLCYNTRLRAETRARVGAIEESLDVIEDRNFHIHTFHSFCHGILDEHLANTDIGIIKIVDAAEKDMNQFNKKYLEIGINYDLIVVDESQDLNETYYKFIKLLLSCSGAKLCLIGDPRQEIYQFNGSSGKYLQNANEYFSREFIDMTLSQSFRLTKPMTHFINGMYGIFKKGKKITTNISRDPSATRIRSKKKSILKPLIINHVPNVDDLSKFIAGCSPRDVLVLMYSTRRGPNKISVRLANKLKEVNIPVSFGNLPEKLETDDSVLMISYHQSKGIERPIVILLDLNKFYFSITGDDPTIVPNLWYVALSRASKYIIAYVDGPFKFINAAIEAIGEKLPEGDVIIRSNDIKWTRSAAFSEYIKYTPSTELWDQIQSGPSWPKLSEMLIKDPIKISQSSILQDMILDYLRTNLASQPEIFVQEYLKSLCGGLNITPDIGRGYYEGYPEMPADHVLTICKKVLFEVLEILQIDPKNLCWKDCRLGNIELSDGIRLILIITDQRSLETKLRWSTCTDDDIIINVLDGRYYLRDLKE